MARMQFMSKFLQVHCCMVCSGNHWLVPKKCYVHRVFHVFSTKPWKALRKWLVTTLGDDRHYSRRVYPKIVYIAILFEITDFFYIDNHQHISYINIYIHIYKYISISLVIASRCCHRKQVLYLTWLLHNKELFKMPRALRPKPS